MAQSFDFLGGRETALWLGQEQFDFLFIEVQFIFGVCIISSFVHRQFYQQYTEMMCNFHYNSALKYINKMERHQRAMQTRHCIVFRLIELPDPCEQDLTSIVASNPTCTIYCDHSQLYCLRSDPVLQLSKYYRLRLLTPSPETVDLDWMTAFIQECFRSMKMEIREDDKVAVFGQRGLLGGGGCMSSQQTKQVVPVKKVKFQVEDNSKALKFDVQNQLFVLEKCTKDIVSYADKFTDQACQSIVMKAIQKLRLGEKYLQLYFQNEVQLVNAHSVVLSSLKELVNQLKFMMRVNTFAGYQLAVFINNLIRFCVKFYTVKGEARITYTEKNSLIACLELLEKIIFQEEIPFADGLSFQLVMMRCGIHLFPIDQNGFVVLAKFLGSFLKSVAKNSLDASFIEDLKEGMFFLMDKYHQAKSQRKYEEYVLVQELKWYVVLLSETRQLPTLKPELLRLLPAYFKQVVYSSSAWESKYSWIEMVQDLATYKPVLYFSTFQNKLDNSSIQVDLSDLELWEQMIECNWLIKIAETQCLISRDFNSIIINQETDQELKNLLWGDADDYNQLCTFLYSGSSSLPSLYDIGMSDKLNFNSDLEQVQQKNTKILLKYFTLVNFEKIEMLIQLLMKTNDEITQRIQDFNNLFDDTISQNNQREKNSKSLELIQLQIIFSVNYEIIQDEILNLQQNCQKSRTYFQAISISDQKVNFNPDLEKYQKKLGSQKEIQKIFQWASEYYQHIDNTLFNIQLELPTFQLYFQHTLNHQNQTNVIGEQERQEYEQKIQDISGVFQKLFEVMKLNSKNGITIGENVIGAQLSEELKERIEEEDFSKCSNKEQFKLLSQKLREVNVIQSCLKQIISTTKSFESTKANFNFSNYTEKALDSVGKQVINQYNEVQSLISKWLRFYDEDQAKLMQLKRLIRSIHSHLLNDRNALQLQKKVTQKFNQQEFERVLSYFEGFTKKDEKLSAEEINKQAKKLNVIYEKLSYFLHESQQFKDYKEKLQSLIKKVNNLSKLVQVEDQNDQVETENKYLSELKESLVGGIGKLAKELKSSQPVRESEGKDTGEEEGRNLKKEMSEMKEVLEGKLEFIIRRISEIQCILKENVEMAKRSKELQYFESITQFSRDDIRILFRVLASVFEQLSYITSRDEFSVTSVTELLQLNEKKRTLVEHKQSPLHSYLLESSDDEPVDSQLGLQKDIIRVIYDEFTDKRVKRLLNFEDSNLDMDFIDNLLSGVKHLFETLVQPETLQIIKSGKTFLQFYGHKVLNSFKNMDWRVRYGMVFALILIKTDLVLSHLNDDISTKLVRIRSLEVNPKIKEILANDNIVQQVNKSIKTHWTSETQRIQQSINQKLQQVKEINEAILQCENNDLVARLKAQEKVAQQEIKEILENIQGIGNQFGLTINFLVDIKQSLEKMAVQVNEINASMKYLRGKSLEQLFGMRKNEILRRKQEKEMNSIYIHLLTQEKEQAVITKLITNQNIADERGHYAEINEFLFFQTKRHLLIHGKAGCGKSTIATKIEEFLWEQYEQGKLATGKESLLLPLFIQLPSLVNPKEYAIENTLKSSFYLFDDKQVNELREQVQEGKIRLVLILDSYDEMKGEFIGQQLGISNNFSKWRKRNCKSPEELQYPKVIFTTRSEVFRDGYQSWFLSDDQNIENLKEIEIMPFNQEQQDEYIRKYCEFSVKKELLNCYTILDESEVENNVQIQRFQEKWHQITQIEFEQGYENYLSATDIARIIDLFKQIQELDMSQQGTLSSNLADLWSVKQFRKTIKGINLESLLQTPFVMEIVVQVLPDLVKEKSNPEKKHLKKNFIQAYVDLKMKRSQKYLLFDKYLHNLKQLSNEEKQKLIRIQRENEQIGHRIFNDLSKNNFFNNYSFQLEKSEDKLIKDLEQFYSNPNNIQDLEHYLKQTDSIKSIKKTFQFEEDYPPSLSVKKQQSSIEAQQNFFNYLESEQFQVDHQINPENIKKEIRLIAEALSCKRITKFSFYKRFLGQYIDNQMGKWQRRGESRINYSTIKQDLMKFIQDLATDMTTRQLTNIMYQEKSQIYKQEQEWSDFYFNDLDDVGEIKKIIRSGLPLSQKKNSFSFQHKSIQEFLFAKEIIDFYRSHWERLDLNLMDELIARQKKKNPGQDKSKVDMDCLDWLLDNEIDVLDCIEQLYDEEKDDQNLQIKNEMLLKMRQKEFLIEKVSQVEKLQEFLRSLQKHILSKQNIIMPFNYGACSFVATEMNESFQFQEFFLKLVLLTKYFSENFVTAGSNAMSLLSYSRVSLRFVDFSGIKLRNAILQRCNLFKTKFKNAQLENCDLSQVNLTQAEFENVDFSNINLNEYGILRGHTGHILCVKFSPDGLTILSAGQDRSIRFWNRFTGAQIGEPLIGHESQVNCIVFNKKGDIFVSGGEDRKIMVWSSDSREQMLEPIVGHEKAVTSLDMSPNQKEIVSASSDANIKVWSMETGEQLAVLSGHTKRINAVRYASHTGRIVSCGDDMKVRVWDRSTGELAYDPLEGHTKPIYSMAVSPDGTLAITGGYLMIRVWDIEKGCAIQGFFQVHSSIIKDITFSADGKKFVSCSDDVTIRVFNTQTRLRLGEPLEGHSLTINSVDVSSDGQCIVTGSNDETIRIWNIKTCEMIGSKLEGHRVVVNDLKLFPDGQTIASCSFDKTIRIWNSRNGQHLYKLTTKHMLTSIAIAPDQSTLCAGTLDWKIHFWNLQSKQTFAHLPAHSNRIKSLNFSPDGQRLVSGSFDKTIRVWILNGFAPYLDPIDVQSGVNCVLYSPDGSRLVSAQDDHTIKIWDSQTLQLIGEPLLGHYDFVNNISFCSDNERFVSSSDDKTVRLWNLKTGQQIGLPIEGHERKIRNVCISQDGSKIISASWDTTIRIWNTQTGKQIGKPLQDSNRIQRIMLAPDESFIVSGSFDNSVRLWTFQESESNKELVGHSERVTCASFSSNGELIATAGQDFTVRVWRSEDGEQVGESIQVMINQVITRIGFSVDGEYVVCRDSEDNELVVRVATGESVSVDVRGQVHSSRVHGELQLTVRGKVVRVEKIEYALELIMAKTYLTISAQDAVLRNCTVPEMKKLLFLEKKAVVE